MQSLPASPDHRRDQFGGHTEFAPRYVWGNVATSTTLPTAVTASTTALDATSDFSTFLNGLTSTLSATNAALQMTARGIYDPATNTFTATTVDFAL